MSVRGIGVDICRAERIAESLRRFGERMERRLFTPDELAYCRGHQDPTPHLAARFAAKEATSKALGTGMSGGVGWTQIEVIQPGGHVPTLKLSGAALARAESMGVTSSHLTLSHDGGMAVACVVLEGA
jgi:holo-[acyl-carrier protein] synthase